MAATVYYTSFRVSSSYENTLSKIRRLFVAAGFAGLIEGGDLTAVKLHFGERGNDTFISPVHVRQVVDKIREAGGWPFVTDTNTLYSGSRDNAVDHLTTAVEHGFVSSVINAPVIIADGLKSDHVHEVNIGLKHFKDVKIAGDIVSADSMIVMSHFKGHGMAGFGGAIKNLAMGCAPAAGKRDQHAGLLPVVDQDACVTCGNCADVCPEGAIDLSDEAAVIDTKLCIGCGECITVCPEGAIAFDWTHDVLIFMEMMAEYAFGAVKGKEKKVGYLNFLMNVTPDCDCVPWSDLPIVPDIGILASTDPVAIDAASVDLINRQGGIQGTRLLCHHGPGEDKFSGMWPDTNGMIQIRYGEEIGLGSSTYELTEI